LISITSKIDASTIPILSIQRDLSIVTIFDNLMIDFFLSPFIKEGISSISVVSFHFICVVIKLIVKSSLLSINTIAGRIYEPDKFVNGNGIITISPFIIQLFI
jgi:hypothetical protein